MVLTARPLLGLATLAAGAAVHMFLQHMRKRIQQTSSSTQHAQAAADSTTAASSNATNTTVDQPCSAVSDRVASSGTTASAEQQVQRLQEAYAAMAAAFAADGLDLAAVSETAAWFETGPAVPWPRRYTNFVPRPLPPASVRLVIVPVAANCPRLAGTLAALARDLLALLPPGYKVYSNARQNLHITVFHLSHPIDTRPNTLDPHSGLQHLAGLQGGDTAAAAATQQQQQQVATQGENFTKISNEQQQQQQVYSVLVNSHSPAAAAAATAVTAMGAAGSQVSVPVNPALLPPPAIRPAITDKQIAAEQAAAAAVVAAVPPFTLQVERVLLARSGVLLVTWTDPSGEVGRLRHQLQHKFPGACSKQSNIIHTTMFRIVQVPAAAAAAEAGGLQQQQQQHACGGNGQLSAAAVASISSACENWTQKLRGSPLSVSRLWWVSEDEFSTVEGNRVPLRCA